MTGVIYFDYIVGYKVDLFSSKYRLAYEPIEERWEFKLNSRGGLIHQDFTKLAIL
jgi:hypothetical protein